MATPVWHFPVKLNDNVHVVEDIERVVLQAFILPAQQYAVLLIYSTVIFNSYILQPRSDIGDDKSSTECYENTMLHCFLQDTEGDTLTASWVVWGNEPVTTVHLKKMD